MIQKILLLMLLWPLVEANASITEVRKDFLDETSLLTATPIITAPAVSASYLICVAAGDQQTSVPTAILHWTDENGQFRSFSYPTVNGVPSGCYLIRNQANTAATIETNGTYSGLYNLFIFGFGFWPGGTQSQGGLKEPLNYSVTGANGGHEFSFPGYPWLFSIVAASNCRWQLSAGWSGMISGAGSQIAAGYGGGNGGFTTLTAGCGYTLRAVQFGTPAAGPGPLIDYEYNLLSWTNATYPKLKTVFTSGGAGATILLAINLAERPNNGLISEGVLASWSNQTSVPCAAAIVGGPSGAPGSCVAPAYIVPGSALQFLTYNTPGQEWGSSPTYSAEVDVIQF